MDLEQLRAEIDQIDEELLRLFLRRMETVERVAAYKLENGLPIFQPQREAEVLETKSRQAGEKMAPYARELFQALMETSRRLQQRLLDQASS